MANATINTDSNGTFKFVNTDYRISDENSNVQFITDANGDVIAINGLKGKVETTDTEITINGKPVTISGSGGATITYGGDENGITEITGLPTGATISGADLATVRMATPDGTGTLTAFDRVYTIIDGETDGITISGGGEVITDLDSDAYLRIDRTGGYFVNNSMLFYETRDTIRGTSEGTAEIYGEDNVVDVDEGMAASNDTLAAWFIDPDTYERTTGSELTAITDAINSDSVTDTSVLNGDKKFEISAPDSSTNQNIDLSASSGKKDVILKDGEQFIRFNDEGGRVDFTEQKASTVIQGNASGNKFNGSTLLAGVGNDVIFAGAYDYVDAGSGVNTIFLNQVLSSSADRGAFIKMFLKQAEILS